MIDQPSVNPPAKPSLRDFVQGLDPSARFDIEVAIKEDGHVVVFHSHPFKDEISWFEFDLGTNKLDFILEDGKIRDTGLPLTRDVAKYMQNSHQILMVLMDPTTGEASGGAYVPLIIHRSEV
jgi:hypothetical protein